MHTTRLRPAFLAAYSTVSARRTRSSTSLSFFKVQLHCPQVDCHLNITLLSLDAQRFDLLADPFRRRAGFLQPGCWQQDNKFLAPLTPYPVHFT